MAAASPPPPWVALCGSVDVASLSVEREREREQVVIRCASRKAYGCGEHGQNLVNGVTLLARTVDYPDDLTTLLSIRISDAALRIVQAELGKGDRPLVRIGAFGVDARGAVHHAGERLLVLELFFSLRDMIGGGQRTYYLVYDATGGPSLHMIGSPPLRAVSTLTPRALAVRHGDDVDLLFVAHLLRPEFPEQGLLVNDVVLCACRLGPPPPLDQSSSSSCCSIGPWQLKKRRYGEQAAPGEFRVNTAFSFDGQAFWVDLARGVVRCDMRGAAARDRAHHVDFDFIGFPPGFQLDANIVKVTRPFWPELLEIHVNTFRTVGQAGDSVKFVSLGHPGCRDPSDRMVTAWTLQHDRGRRRWWWRKDVEFSVRSLWELEAFKRAGLPEREPELPVLMPDGALCLLLTNSSCRRRGDPIDERICVLDMRSMSILWAGGFRNYGRMSGPTFLPSDFFNNAHPLVPSKRKVPTILFTQD